MIENNKLNKKKRMDICKKEHDLFKELKIK